jgi:hypothetical protein
LIFFLSFIVLFLGYYVVAGIPIQIDVLEQIGANGWSARIGCHSDDLGVRSVNCFRVSMLNNRSIHRTVMNCVDGLVYLYLNLCRKLEQFI